MEKVFVDANIVIDIAYRKPIRSQQLEGKLVYISPLSIHILSYIKNIKVASRFLQDFVKQFYVEDLTENVLTASLDGPTDDLEDNIQLHSALKADCSYFITDDKKLLKIGNFGKVRIVSSIK